MAVQSCDGGVMGTGQERHGRASPGPGRILGRRLEVEVEAQKEEDAFPRGLPAPGDSPWGREGEPRGEGRGATGCHGSLVGVDARRCGAGPSAAVALSAREAERRSGGRKMYSKGYTLRRHRGGLSAPTAREAPKGRGSGGGGRRWG